MFLLILLKISYWILFGERSFIVIYETVVAYFSDTALLRWFLFRMSIPPLLFHWFFIFTTLLTLCFLFLTWTFLLPLLSLSRYSLFSFFTLHLIFTPPTICLSPLPTTRLLLRRHFNASQTSSQLHNFTLKISYLLQCINSLFIATANNWLIFHYLSLLYTCIVNANPTHHAAVLMQSR